MPVALLPPVSSSGGEWRGELPLTEARRYARGRGNSRWHRLRSGVLYGADHQFAWCPDGRVVVHYWCGSSAHDGPGKGALWYVDDLPTSEPACGTCVGRALGAKQDETPPPLPPLLFSPRWQRPPVKCPGSGSRTLWAGDERARVGSCLACGETVPIRAKPFPSWGAGPEAHLPGVGLVDPCPFHAWLRLTAVDGGAACACGWDREKAYGPLAEMRMS